MIAVDSSKPLEGALKLALLDARGAECFSGTKEEARFSFIAPLIVWPFLIYLELLDPEWAPYLKDWWKISLLQILFYAIGIMAVFCAADVLLRFHHKSSGNLLRFISAYNWASVVQTLIFVPLALLYYFSLVDVVILTPLAAIVALGLVCYQWFVCKTTLRITGYQALLLVILEVLIALSMNFYTSSIMERA